MRHELNLGSHTTDDVVANPATASVVTQINGQDAVTYVGDAAFSTTFNQDADAAYNTMFWSKALNGVAGSSGGFYGGTRANYIYRGPNTTLTFENGTTLVTLNKATVKVNMTGVVNGQTFYQKFCDPATSIFAAPGSGSHATAPAGPNIPGYPSPLLASTDMTISGYYLDGTGYEDVAVLVVETFETESPPEFQKTAQQFFAKAKADGKTKLVVDLQVNNGGYIVLGVDLFRQLFPHIVQDGFSRWKETDAFMALSQIASQASANIDPYTDPSPFDVEMYASAFNWRTDLNLTNQPFTSFEDKFNPHVFQNTPYTNIMRWDLNSSFITTNATCKSPRMAPKGSAQA